MRIWVFFFFFRKTRLKKKGKIILNDGDDARAILWKATYENLFNNIFSRETCLMRDLQLTRWKMEHIKVIKSIHFTINHLIWYTIKFSLSSSTFKAVSCIEFDNSFRDRWEERKYGKMGWKQTDVKGNRIRRGEYRMDVYCKNAGGWQTGRWCEGRYKLQWNGTVIDMRWDTEDVHNDRGKCCLEPLRVCVYDRSSILSKHTWYNSDSLQGSEDSKCPESGKVA